MVKSKKDAVAGSDAESDARDSSSDDSDSDSEAGDVPVPDGDPSANQLSLVDDAVPSLIYQAAPELGEEDEGEGGFDGEGDIEEAMDHTVRNESTAQMETDLDKGKKKKKKRKKLYHICLTSCKYDSVRRVSKRFGFKEVLDDEDWNLFWTDYSVSLERVMDMKKYQKINHFPGMSEICRKDLLARNMNRMLKLFPKEYNVFPRSWCLPADYGDFAAFTRQKKHKTYILKPESGCQGKGIWVTKNPKEIKAQEHQLCQQYLSKPFLVDGFKFDLRIYVLVVSCDPLRIFVFKDGLARFATTKYIDPSHNNVSNVFMHLTNYAINKTSSDFIRDDEAGSKRRITTINKWLSDNGYDLDKMWKDIDDCIIKTLISAHSILKHNYRTCFPNHIRGSACFEILGFDVMMDKKLKPFLLEVNHSPSFHTDAKLDKEIKEALLFDTMNIVNFGAVDKRKCIEEERRKIKDRLFQKQSKKDTKEDLDKAQIKWLDELEQYENAHMGNYRRIYPMEGTEKYEKYFHSSGSLYQETAAFKARSEAARQQREEISRKQEKLEAMLKKKKDLARPESPGSRRKRVTRRPNMPQRKLNTGRGEDDDDDDMPRNNTWEYRVHYTLAKNALNKPYGSMSSNSGYQDTSRDLGLFVDSRQPMEIVEDEELERISGLLQRDNLVRGLGIVEHVYRLLHCTPGTMGIQLKNDHKYNANHVPSGLSKHKRLPGIDNTGNDNHPSNQTNHRNNPAGVSSKQQLWSQHNHGNPSTVEVNKLKLAYHINEDGLEQNTSHVTLSHNVMKGLPPDLAVFEREKQRLRETKDRMIEGDDRSLEHSQSQHTLDDPGGRSGLAHVLDGNPYSYNNNNSNSVGAAARFYQQGGATHQGGRLVKGHLPPQLGNDRNLPGNVHRTRYSNRKPHQLGPGTRSGNPTVVPESAKGTPRTTGPGLSQQQQQQQYSTAVVSQTPPPLGSQGQILSQYQYSFPNMVKVSSTHLHQQVAPQPLGVGGGAGGLSVVSAPAPLAHRPEAGSAGSVGGRSAFSGQPSLENVHLKGAQKAASSGPRVRGVVATTAGGGKVKELELRGNHAVVFS